MFIHPWDAALDEAEWRTWIADGHDFGQLVANGGPGDFPSVVPTHFCPAYDSALLVHLARPNPIWPVIERDANVVLSVVDDYAFIPTTWRAKAGGPEEDGVPTSYYAAVVFACRAEIVDEPQGKVDLLKAQLAHFQPNADYADVAVGQPPYGRLLSGIRGLRLHVVSVVAKFKYDDHNPVEHRQSVAARLTARGRGRDAAAAGQQRRRLNRIGTWIPTKGDR
ncbi:MAG: hypothetical protein JWR37_2482 [Mycobacterium sp.]|jgi:transcriptional regulator|nr:hypothetical protein [Mycobacterium sp.]